MQLNPEKDQYMGMNWKELFEKYVIQMCWSNEPSSRKEIMGYYKRTAQVVPIQEETHSDIESEEDDDDEIQAAKDKKTQMFIRNAKRKHGIKTNSYSCTYYKDNKTPVKVKCYIHGKFKILPYAHLAGGGCKHCKQEVKFDEMYNKHRENRTMVQVQEMKFSLE
jgi:hypothetical protein